MNDDDFGRSACPTGYVIVVLAMSERNIYLIGVSLTQPGVAVPQLFSSQAPTRVLDW